MRFQFSSCWVAPIFQLNGWMQDETQAGNEKSISPPLICINVSLGQNFIPQPIPSLSAHFLFTRNGWQSGSGEIFWDFSLCGTGMKQCLDACLSVCTIPQFRSNACIIVCFYNLRALVTGIRANCLFLCVPASSSEKIFVCVCFSGLKGGFCRFHFILESAFIPPLGIQGCSLWRQSGLWDLCSSWCSEEQKERHFYCDDFYLVTFLLWQLLFNDFSDFQRSTMIY